MADDLRTRKAHDRDRGAGQNGAAHEIDGGFRVVDVNVTNLEKLVLCMIYHEMLTVAETALVLSISQGGVKKILWRVTDRLMK